MQFAKIFILISFLSFSNHLIGQNYQGINGSSYSGSLSSQNNPASIVNTPFAWDVTPFAVQAKQSTNAFIIKKYSLVSTFKNAELSLKNGTKKRFFFANQNIRLLNTRISLNAKTSIAFGANIRNYFYITNSKSNWQDTLIELSDFMKLNSGHLPLSGNAAGSVWGEIYFTYAHTIIDDGTKLLNAGITLKINHPVAGAYANASQINYTSLSGGNGNNFLFNNGNLQYGYSSNFDAINNNTTSVANRKAFLQNAHYYGMSADIGVEYMILSDEDLDAPPDNIYDTKIGIVLLDLGNNKYEYGSKSRRATGSKQGITNTILEKKFSPVRTFNNFNDSLATISNSITLPVGSFNIYEPTRLVINADKYITQNFFINAELTIPIINLASKNTLFIKDMNLLAVTSRWETKSLGGYFPVVVNVRGQVWVGGAFKAGPVLIGIHNLGDIFKNNKSQNGGFYLALTIRPAKRYDRNAHYPVPKLTRQVKRSLECPKL